MDVRTDLPADTQPAEPVQQRDGALDDVAVDSQAGAVRGAAAGDQRFDALGPDQTPVLVVVIATVGQQVVGRRRGRPTRPRTGGTASISGISWVTSLRLPPVSDTASDMPWPSVKTWCFEPVRARSTGLGPLLGRP